MSYQKPKLEESNNGIVINGIYFEADWITEIINSVTEKVLVKQNEQKLHHKASATEEINFTAGEVAKKLNRAVSTITRHCQKGLLNGHKAGKSWIIGERDYLNYKENRRADE